MIYQLQIILPDRFPQNLNIFQPRMPSSGNLQAIISFLKTFSSLAGKVFTPEKISDGIYFATILQEIDGFNFGPDELRKDVSKWSFRLNNLRRLLQKIEEYFNRNDRGVISHNIDLVDIAKRYSTIEIEKYFEVVVSVLMQSGSKEDYIEKIMTLDEVSQQQFVTIVQNSMDKRLCSLEEGKNNKFLLSIQTLESENMSLYEELEEMSKANETLEMKILTYQNSLQEMELGIAKNKRDTKISESIEDLAGKYEQSVQIIESLKEKIILISRAHQTEVAEQILQINNLKEKLKESETLEEMVLFYREKYEQTISHLNRINVWDKEKTRLTSTLQEKDFVIGKLQQKIEDMTRNTMEMEERELELKIEMEKRQARLKEFEKDMKTRLNLSVSVQGSQINHQVLTQNYNTAKKKESKEGKELGQILQRSEDNDEHYEQVKKQLQALEKRYKQLQKENAKLSKKAENAKLLEMQKRKLEAIIIEMDHKNSEQLQMLVSGLYETHREYGNLFRTFVKK